MQENAEVGVPPWSLGGARHGALPDGRLVYARSREGYESLVVRQPDGTTSEVATFSVIDDLRVAGEDEVVAIVATATSESAIARIMLADSSAHSETVRPPRDLGQFAIASRHLSRAEPIQFATGGGQRAYALFYAPANRDVTPSTTDLPPLLVRLHGGPTSQAYAALSLGIQFWTSRGFAVVDVDYRGSSGYGRAYRNLLRERWGVVDVEDCMAAARHLADQGRVDPGRMCIRGGSAGGFTALAALAHADTPFAAGADLYGIADLEFLAQETQVLGFDLPAGEGIEPVRIDNLG